MSPAGRPGNNRLRHRRYRHRRQVLRAFHRQKHCDSLQTYYVSAHTGLPASAAAD